MSDERHRKIFIGGLEQSVIEEDLREYFEPYGTVKDCVVIMDSKTGKSRRFGFVTFDSRDAVDRVQDARPHFIHGSEVDLRRAVPKRHFENLYGHLNVKRLFVGGLGWRVNKDNLRAYFSNFGNVRNVDVVVNPETQKKRGFAFVDFDDYDPVDKIILLKYHNINGKSVEVKKAMSRYETRLLKQAQEERDKFKITYGNPNVGGGNYAVAPGYGPGYGPMMF